MDPGEQTTGTHDEHYNLISVLYHALHGAENCDMYALDAEATGNEEQAAFFRDVQAMQMEIAEQAKGMLGIADAMGGITPGGMAGGMPPATGAPATGTEPLDVSPIAEDDAPRLESDVAAPADEDNLLPEDEEAPLEDLPLEGVPPQADDIQEAGDVPPTIDVPSTPDAAARLEEGAQMPPGATSSAGMRDAGSMLRREEDVVTPEEAPMEEVTPRSADAPPDEAAPTAEATDVRAGEAPPFTEDVPPATDVPRTPEATTPGAAEPRTATSDAATPTDEEITPLEDMVSDVPAETTERRIDPEDLDETVSALRGGVTNLALETALAEIDGWEQRLEESGDPQLAPIAENLRQLRVLLTDDAADRAQIGRLLNTLGVQVQELASSGLGEPIADRLQQLGGVLNTEGRELSGA